MLGKTAGGLFWMSRYMERSENNARLLDAGFRISLTRSSTAATEWKSILTTAGSLVRYLERNEDFESAKVINFLLRDAGNPSSILSVLKQARDNARLVRTALTREVWEAINDSWMLLSTRLKRPVRESDLPDVLAAIRQQNAQVRGALSGTMLRNDGYNFARLGTFIERADNTARILDVKYFLSLVVWHRNQRAEDCRFPDPAPPDAPLARLLLRQDPGQSGLSPARLWRHHPVGCARRGDLRGHVVGQHRPYFRQWPA